MRVFLALPLESGVRKQLVGCQEAWAKMIGNVKWVEQENLHLTLKFLGEVSEQDLVAVKRAAGRVAEEFPPFSVNLSGPGVFPSVRKGRVLWVGLKDEGERLKLMAQRLDAELAPLNFSPGKAGFTPHLTLGRLRQPAAVTIPALPVEGVPVRLTEVVLYRSVLTPHGPLYQALAEFGLGKK